MDTTAPLSIHELVSGVYIQKCFQTAQCKRCNHSNICLDGLRAPDELRAFQEVVEYLEQHHEMCQCLELPNYIPASVDTSTLPALVSWLRDTWKKLAIASEIPTQLPGGVVELNMPLVHDQKMSVLAVNVALELLHRLVSGKWGIEPGLLRLPPQERWQYHFPEAVDEKIDAYIQQIVANSPRCSLYN